MTACTFQNPLFVAVACVLTNMMRIAEAKVCFLYGRSISFSLLNPYNCPLHQGVFDKKHDYKIFCTEALLIEVN